MHASKRQRKLCFCFLLLFFNPFYLARCINYVGIEIRQMLDILSAILIPARLEHWPEMFTPAVHKKKQITNVNHKQFFKIRVVIKFLFTLNWSIVSKHSTKLLRSFIQVFITCNPIPDFEHRFMNINISSLHWKFYIRCNLKRKHKSVKKKAKFHQTKIGEVYNNVYMSEHLNSCIYTGLEFHMHCTFCIESCQKDTEKRNSTVCNMDTNTNRQWATSLLWDTVSGHKQLEQYYYSNTFVWELK